MLVVAIFGGIAVMGMLIFSVVKQHWVLEKWRAKRAESRPSDRQGDSDP